MNVTPTALPEVLLIEPAVHRDARGFFLETYQAARYRAAGIDVTFVQANQSRSVRNTLRGLHWQDGAHPQAKLIRVVVGAVFDVAVDIRPHSPTFGQWVGVHVSADNFLQLYIPVGFAHGFCVLSDAAELEYQCSDVYDPASERGLLWNDPDLGIAWPVRNPIISERDRRHPTLKDLRGRAAGETGLLRQ
ncbi:MAG: dTDP-4-dehydrorhamnose 3,5-epimerase [Acidobacteria bacterium]|nr:dTDP-4-dehydrorhamnose 3,5-epimerase [Acidobacteriota bacterium]